MMKAEIIAASDTHGNNGYLEELEKCYPRADLYVHCGDLEDYASRYPDWIFVRGNNDWDTNMPLERIVTIAGVRIYLCHSHMFSYYNREQQLAAVAKENDCKMVIFGHTHIPMVKKVDGIILINPGSMTFPRDGKPPCYAKIIIEDDGKIRASLIHAPDWPFKAKKSWWY